MPPRTLPDGSELIEPIRCVQCGALAYFVLGTPDPNKPNVESEYTNAPRARIAWKAVLTLRVPLDARPKPRVICVSYSPLCP